MRVEGFEEVVEGALLHRLDGRVRGLRHGHEDDRDARVDPADLLVDVRAGLVGQVEIEQNDVRQPGADVLEARSAGAGDHDSVRRGGEGLAHLLRSQGKVVVDEQQLGHDALALRGAGKGTSPLHWPLGTQFATRRPKVLPRYRCRPTARTTSWRSPTGIAARSVCGARHQPT